MSNYTYPAGTRTFGARDNLPAGSQDKVTSGSQLDVEFTALAQMSASKLDKNGNDFTGTISAAQITTGILDGGTF